MATKRIIRRLLYALSSTKRREFYRGVLLPRDDYYLRYFGHQLGRLKPEAATEVLGEIDGVESVELMWASRLQVDTSLSVGELWLLGVVVRAKKPKLICEVGTFNGITAVNLAANASESRVVTIDLPREYAGGLSDISKGDKNVTNREEVGKYIERFVGRDRIRQVLADSFNLDWSTLGGVFDLVFIDGCHNEKYVRRDTENAERYLSEEGVLIWHDYGQSQGVTKVVDEFAKRDDFRVAALYGTRLAVALKKK